jgi:hypothetical protein
MRENAYVVSEGLTAMFHTSSSYAEAFLLPPLSTLSGMDLIGQVQRRLSGSPGGLDADWIDYDGRWDGGASGATNT